MFLDTDNRVLLAVTLDLGMEKHVRVYREQTERESLGEPRYQVEAANLAMSLIRSRSAGMHLISGPRWRNLGVQGLPSLEQYMIHRWYNVEILTARKRE